MITRGSSSIVLSVLVGCGSPGGGGGDDEPPLCDDAPGDRTVEAGSERFGTSVSAGPDADGDGHPDVLVGDPSTEQSAELGIVTLVSGATGEVLRTWEGEEPGDAFGTRVSLGPDADGDGLADVLIAAPAHGASRGRVVLYSGADGGQLDAWDGVEAARLGQDISLGPDVDGDGLGDVLLSDELSYDEKIDGDVVLDRRGRVYLHASTGTPLATLDAPERLTDFGDNVQLGPDVDGDGAADVLVADPQGGDRFAGVVHLYSGASGSLLRTWAADASSYYFGNAASLGPDTDGDGVPDVAIAMRDTETTEVRVELRSGASGELLHTWRNDNWRVVRGDRLVVAEDLDGDGRGDVVLAADIAITSAEEPEAITTFVFSGGDGAELASWSHAEHRDFETRAVGAMAAPCGALIAIGVADTWNEPGVGTVELRRLAP